MLYVANLDLGGKLRSRTVQEVLFGTDDPLLQSMRHGKWSKMVAQPHCKKLINKFEPKADLFEGKAWTYQKQHGQIDSDCFHHVRAKASWLIAIARSGMRTSCGCGFAM